MTAVLYRQEASDSGEGAAYRIRWDGGPGPGGEPGFDGPLELLLRMVRDGRADPLQIEIGSITRQYLEALELIEMLDLRVGSEFLKLATALLRIKARRLLPSPAPPGSPGEDPQAELEARLRDYARYRDAAHRLRRSLEARSSVWVRGPSLPDARGEGNGAGAAPEGESIPVDLFAVVEAFRRVVVRARSRPPPPLPRSRISLGVMIGRIEEAVPTGAARDFEELLFEVVEGQVDRSTLVAAFLAVLELVRRCRVSVVQEQDFGPLRIEGIEPGSRPASGPASG